jgi:hypothetical protein
MMVLRILPAKDTVSTALHLPSKKRRSSNKILTKSLTYSLIFFFQNYYLCNSKKRRKELCSIV